MLKVSHSCRRTRVWQEGSHHLERTLTDHGVVEGLSCGCDVALVVAAANVVVLQSTRVVCGVHRSLFGQQCCHRGLVSLTSRNH